MKRNDKGFSLIELIIVVAIMAILVAVIAPNLTKYLSKSKKNADIANADEIEKIYEQALAMTGVEVADPDASILGGWEDIKEDSLVYDSDAADVGGYTAFPKYIAEILEGVPVSKTTGGNFQVKITKGADERYSVEVKY